MDAVAAARAEIVAVLAELLLDDLERYPDLPPVPAGELIGDE